MSSRGVLPLALALALMGCATTRRAQDLGLDKVRIEFVDFVFQQDEVSPAQPIITVTPTLMFRNPNDVPVELVKVEIEIRGDPQFIQIRDRKWPVNEEIPAGGSIHYRPNIFATLRSEGGRAVALSPLYVTGRAFFKALGGGFSQGFVRQQVRIEYE